MTSPSVPPPARHGPHWITISAVGLPSRRARIVRGLGEGKKVRITTSVHEELGAGSGGAHLQYSATSAGPSDRSAAAFVPGLGDSAGCSP